MNFSMTFSTVFQDLRFSCHIPKFLKFPPFWGIFFFYLKQFNRHKLWCLPNCVPFALFNYSSLSYIVLALSSAVTKLPNKTLIFHNFKDRRLNSMTFQAWKMEFLNSMTFQVFHDLCEP